MIKRQESLLFVQSVMAKNLQAQCRPGDLAVTIIKKSHVKIMSEVYFIVRDIREQGKREIAE